MSARNVLKSLVPDVEEMLHGELGDDLSSDLLSLLMDVGLGLGALRGERGGDETAQPAALHLARATLPLLRELSRVGGPPSLLTPASGREEGAGGAKEEEAEALPAANAERVRERGAFMEALLLESLAAGGAGEAAGEGEEAEEWALRGAASEEDRETSGEEEEEF